MNAHSWDVSAYGPETVGEDMVEVRVWGVIWEGVGIERGQSVFHVGSEPRLEAV